MLGLKHLLDKEHLSLLVYQLITILFVLGTLYWDGETRLLPYINFILHLRINGEGRWLDIGLADLTQAAFTGGPVLLPDFELLVFLTLY